ncbi:MAG TPA: hypothetical protein VLB84_05950 [Bacteroidia bacterium]|nr:hypothetical protein [Bacteroidia bacterium]
MNILDQTIEFRSPNYVNKLIVDPLVSFGHLKFEENDIKKLTLIIKDALENSKTLENLASRFGHYTKNWNIDWRWIAFHIIQDNYCIRRANEFKKLLKSEIKVYKNSIYEMNFPAFNKLYLTDWTNPKSAPRVFLLSELAANGSNLGRKKEEWKPVIGITDFGFYKYPESDEIVHYYDSSYITTISDGDIWDEQEQKFKNDKKVTRKFNIRITVNGKDYKV